MNTFEHEIRVTQSDLDELNHVNNVRYVQWVQDVAEAHWLSMATPDMMRKYIWVVLRHEIDYARAALLNDALIARTWVGHSEGVKSERHVEFHHSKTNVLIAKAKTTWCLLDANTKRPKRVEEVMSIFR